MGIDTSSVRISFISKSASDAFEREARSPLSLGIRKPRLESHRGNDLQPRQSCFLERLDSRTLRKQPQDTTSNVFIPDFGREDDHRVIGNGKAAREGSYAYLAIATACIALGTNKLEASSIRVCTYAHVWP